MKKRKKISRARMIKKFKEGNKSSRKLYDNIGKIRANMEEVKKEVMMKLQEVHDRDLEMQKRIQLLTIKMRKGSGLLDL